MSRPPEPRDAFHWVHHVWGPALRCAPLARIAHHLFTTRRLVLDPDGEGDGWAIVARAMGLAPGALVRLTQVHGAGVTVIRREDPAPDRHDGNVADIVLCEHPDVAVAVQVADCVPLLLADARTGVVAAVHLGWRGAAAGVVGVAVDALARELGSCPSDLTAAAGPSIGPCCYEVGGEVREAFTHAGFDRTDLARWFVAGPGARPHLDLWQATRDALVAAGLAAAHIHLCGLCTATSRETFFSYRADGPGTGRMVGVIRATPKTED